MPNKMVTSPDLTWVGLYTSLIRNKEKKGDKSPCLTAVVSMLLAIVIYLEENFPNDGRQMMQDYLNAYYNRIDGLDTEQ